MLTNDERAALATELCGLEKAKPYDGLQPVLMLEAGYYLDGKRFCYIKDFDPENNWNHMRLVMEGLVKHLQESRGHEPHDAWYWLFTKLRKKIEPGKPLNFADDVCAAGLEILRKDGT